jgi:hypothetical protein
MPRTPRFLNGFIAFAIGIFAAALLVYLSPYVLNLRRVILDAARAVFGVK